MIPPALDLTLEYFPEYRKIVKLLFRQDDSFHSLCDDFRDCFQAMEFWCNSPMDNENAASLCDEYKALWMDLKKEIEECLKEYDNCSER